MSRSIVRRISLLAILLQMLATITAATGQAAPLPQRNDFAALWEQIDAIKTNPPTFQDDFRTWDGQWSTRGQSTAFLHKGADETFTIQVFARNQVSWSTHAALDEAGLADYLVEVDAVQQSGHGGDNGYGLLFRYVDEQNFYLFGISDGRYGLVRVVDDEWEELFSLAESKAFDATRGAVNRLGVLVEGTQITLLINGEVVEQVEDDTFPHGAIGLAVGAFDNRTIEVAFDNVMLWSLAEQPLVEERVQPTVGETALDDKAVWTQLEEIRAAAPTYYDEFRRNRGDWPLIDNEVKRYAYQNRQYHITLYPDNRVTWSINDAIAGGNATDFLVEVDAALVAGPPDGEYGLVFRFVDSDNFYYFSVSDGQFVFAKREAGEWQRLLNWTDSAHIELAGGAPNRLAVLAQGETFTLLVNDIPLAQVRDATFASGRIGVAVGSFVDGGVEVAFDNLEFWSLATTLSPTTPVRTGRRTTVTTPTQWTTFDGPAFTLEHPADWRVTQDPQGQISVTGTGAEAVTIWPAFIQGEISATLARTILTGYTAQSDRTMNWSRPHELAANALSVNGANSTHTAVAAIAWVNTSQGAAPTLYLLRAPTATFASLEETFVRILSSFQVKGATQTPAPNRPTYHFVEWHDPAESAFSTQVPDGWQVEGRLFRAAAVDVRPWLQLTAPDGNIQVFSGDARIPPFTLPNWTLEWVGIGEGQWYSPGYGVQMLVSRYLPGEEFAAMYISEMMGLAGCTIDAMTPLRELEAALLDLQRRQGVTLFGEQMNVGEVRFTCQDGGETLKGYVLAHTSMIEYDGMGVWGVPTLVGYLASAQQEGEAQAVLDHLAQTWRINPQWAAMQQGTTAAVAGIVAATGSAIADTISSSFNNAQATQDRLAQDWSDTLLEVDRVQDQRTGQVYTVRSGATYHWIDARGNIVGTNAHFNPDGLRFEEMVRVR